MERKYVACNLCEAICGLEVTVEQGRITSVRGDAEDVLSRGHICPKGVALQDIHEDPERLRRPVRRQEDGSFAEVSWDEALRVAVEGLARVQRDHGRDAVALYLGNPNVHSLGSLTHGTAFARVLGSRNTYSATSVDQLPHQLVAHWLFGHQLLLPVPDLDRATYLLVLGANPMASNGSLMTAPDFPGRLRDLRARGGRMVVLDPRRTETAKAADEHLFVRPGTDAVLLLAMVREVLAQGWASPAAYLDGVEDVRGAVEAFTLERAGAVSGVAADDIARLTRELVESRGVVYGRMGLSTQGWGTVCAWAVTVLNALTGALDRPGGAMFTTPAVDIVGRGFVGRGSHGRWRSRVRGLPESGGELPVATLADEMLTAGEGQVRGLVTTSGNPVLSTPDGKRLDEAVSRLDFMVSVDIYVNETTRHADVILPPTSHLERDHYDLIFHALAVRNTARFSEAVFAKPAGAKHDWEIFRDLALGLRRARRDRVGLRRRVMEWGRLRTSPTRIVDGMLRTGSAKLSVRALRKAPHGVDLGAPEPVLPGRLRTRSKRVQLAVPEVLAEVVRLETEVLSAVGLSGVGPAAAGLSAVGPAAAGADGLVLIGRRHQRDCNSWMHNSERLTKGRSRHELLIHPDDLSKRGLADGARVTVTSRVGSVVVEARSSDDMMPGVVSLPHGYGHATNPQTGASRVPGVSINDLTDPERLDVSGNAAFNGVPVEVGPA